MIHVDITTVTGLRTDRIRAEVHVDQVHVQQIFDDWAHAFNWAFEQLSDLAGVKFAPGTGQMVETPFAVTESGKKS